MKYIPLLLLIILPYLGNAQTIITVAGNGVPTFAGDGGPATSGSLHRPIGCAIDNSCNLYISDFSNSRIRKVSASGIISTVCGTGVPGFSGDGGPAVLAQISNTEKITVDAAGNVYLSDFTNHRVRKINTSGIINTIAGNGTPGYSGDGGPATAAQLWYPSGLAVDAAGNVYISDEWNNRIRKINTAGVITTIAGNGPTGYMAGGYGGDGGPAIAAAISFPVGITVNSAGEIIFADGANSRVRKIDLAGIITTVAGNGILGSTGDGGMATAGEIQTPEGVAVDAAGVIYICEAGGNRVRVVSATGIINTLAGNGSPGFSGDGGPATAATVNFPEGIFVDPTSSCLYISDANNNRIRRIGACTGYACAIIVPTCDSVSLPDTLHLCLADTLTMPTVLTGTNVVYSIAWSPATGLSSATVLNPLLTVSSAGWYHVSVRSILPEEHVTNGDFTAGSTGFTTTYVVGYPSTSSSTPGNYAVATNPYLYDPAWPAMGDHTSGTGNMLIVDGSYTSGASFWCQTMPVSPNTDYIFTVWTVLLHTPLPSFQLTINSVNISTFTTSGTSGIWQQYQVLWNSGTATSANICMSDLGTSGYGNDFAIDDISLMPLCVTTDSVYISLNVSGATLTHTDTTICTLGMPVTLTAPSGYTAPVWSTGATTSTITIAGGGTYWVRSASTCGLSVDTFHVAVGASTTFASTRDTAICPGATAMLSAPASFVSSLWNTGATTATITVNVSGTYWVSDVNLATCTINVDTFHVNVLPPPLISLPNDTSLCPGQSIVLSSPSSSGTYLWNTGSTASTITVTVGGLYVLSVTNNGCTASDSILIILSAIPFVDLGRDTLLCSGEVLMLSTVENALWSTGITGTTINVHESGVYWAIITNQCGSRGDTVIVEVGACSVGVPSAFSPNGDGSNDILYVRGVGLKDIDLKIYNRWGQMIFETIDQKKGWDGTWGGTPQSVEIYGYVLNYSFVNGATKTLKGNITLLR